ncbi:MAG TPA: hypothetical protein VFE62_23525 [Gemmataceae bacterium]|nr:hypothetical protein [Gemmataceae bacterium]
MGVRRIRRMQRQADMKESRRKNGALKKKENERRNRRIIGILKAGKLPYLPSVMSWLSAQLHKPSSRITQEEVDAFTK